MKRRYVKRSILLLNHILWFNNSYELIFDENDALKHVIIDVAKKFIFVVHESVSMFQINQIKNKKINFKFQ